MKKINLLVFLALTIFGLSGQAFAIPIITLVPHPPAKIDPGQNFFLDVNVSGLNNTLLGAFSMDVVFDPSLIFLPAGSGSATWGTGLGNVGAGQAVVGATPSVPGSGVFSFYEVSLLEGHAATCVFCDPTLPYLEDLQRDSFLQGDSFKLATLAFYDPLPPIVGVPGPTASFSTAHVVLSDDLGNEIGNSDMGTVSTPGITVPVSEPPSVFLLAIGLIPLILRRRLRGLSKVGKDNKEVQPICICKVFPATALFASLLLSGIAQAQDYEIPLKSGTVRLSPGLVSLGGPTVRMAAVATNYLIVQFDHSPGKQELTELADIGITPVSFVYNNAWICRIQTSSLSNDILKRYGILASAPWLPDYKLTDTLKQGHSPTWAIAKSGELKVLVRFFKDVAHQDMQDLLSSLAKTFSSHEGSPNVWAIEIAPARVADLAASPLVESMSEGPVPFQPVNDSSRNVIGVDLVQNANLSLVPPDYTNGLSGLGVNIAVSEYVATNHPDFQIHDAAGNVIGSRFVNSSTGNAHGTHVAGTIGGNGWNSDKGINQGTAYQWRGMAPEATLISGGGYGSYITHASNHSYVMTYGNYGTPAQVVDSHINGNGINGVVYQRPHIWAVANQGVYAEHGTEIGYYSIYSPAKNALGVGGVNANDGSLWKGSSLGPTFDGRIKPDVVAGSCKNTAAPETPYDGLITVNIDYIRVYDPDAVSPNATCQNVPASGGAQPVQCWEFNQDNNFEGWLEQISQNIYNKRVVGGTLAFEVKPIKETGKDYAFGWVKNLSLSADPKQFIDIRYNIGPVPKPFDALVQIFWSRAGSTNPYVDGNINNNIKVDGIFNVQTFPVGQFGMGLNPAGGPTGVSGWTGTITGLDLFPLMGERGITSTAVTGNTYVGDCGTSMAAPAVTGTTALLLQRFSKAKSDYGYELDLDNSPPLPSTLKTVLIQTATDLVHEVADARDPPNPDTGAPVLYYKGPDYATGYGLVNARAADDLIRGGESLDCGSIGHPVCQSSLSDTIKREVFEFTLDPNFDELKTTVAWDDFPGSGSISETLPKLVNDIDLVLVDPNGLLHYAWRLTPPPTAACHASGSCSNGKDPIQQTDIKPAGRGRDHLNNVEQVQIDHPMAGTWRIIVEGYNLQAHSKPQSYSLATSAHNYIPPNPAINTLIPLSTRNTTLTVAKEDLNADGCIDRSDLDLLLANLRTPAPYNGAYDLNGDNRTNIADSRYLVTKFSLSLGKPCH